MKKKLLSAFGLKFYPFGRDLPVEALFRSPAIDAFCRKVEFTVPDGGFALVAGDPGTGKSVTLRLLAAHLAELRDVSVAYLEHPQSSVGDFYRELGDLFNVALKASPWIGLHSFGMARSGFEVRVEALSAGQWHFDDHSPRAVHRRSPRDGSPCPERATHSLQQRVRCQIAALCGLRR